MAVIGGDWPTLLDITNRTDPNGGLATIIEMLQQQNPILVDAPFFEANSVHDHELVQRTGLPTVYYRRINQGIPRSKSTTAVIRETMANLEALAQIDKRQVQLNGGVGSSWFNSENISFMESMNQQIAETTFYGSEASVPEEFTGLAIRYSSITAASGDNIIDAGGTSSDNTSVWLVTWGERATHFRYPKGAGGAIQHEDKGEQLATDDSGNQFFSFMHHWQWQGGLAVADWAANVRIANVDVSNLIAESSAADLIKLMIKAVHKIPQRIMGRQVIYTTGTVLAMLDIQARETVANSGLTYETVDGRQYTSFRGIPIRRVDQLLENEARVT
jgi:hypothetical protein